MVMIILAASMVGASLGIMVADQDALLSLKRTIVGQAAANIDTQPALTQPEIRREPSSQETPKAESQPADKVISTGLSSVDSILYSSEQDYAHLTFNLEEADLVRTGVLSSPDRIYIDLRDNRPEQGTRVRLGEQKALKIGGDLVSRVRIAERPSGATRVVLDLKRPCSFNYQIRRTAPSELSVELRPRASGASRSKRSSPGATGQNDRWTLSQYPSQ
jgi:hypothetical protein